jgi:hypothetical protein
VLNTGTRFTIGERDRERKRERERERERERIEWEQVRNVE